jgi:endonuclease/exonuclease/phosphatase family metal-dependent hydrolase
MRITVLTINIWNRSGPWEERRAMLRAGIEALNPDVIGMQEVMSDGTHTTGVRWASPWGRAR